MKDIQALLKSEDVEERFDKLLGEKGASYLSSVLSVVNNNKLLSKSDPKTVLTAAATAASLGLPINQSLGYAWIVPYKGQAQFQLGVRGFVQLAMRTNEYRKLNAVPVYGNQFNSYNPMTEELDADFSVQGEGTPCGYVGYFELKNGFSKLVYWSAEKVRKHAARFSKSVNNGPWKTDFDAMAVKTVLKDIIRKWGPTSVELIKAIDSDQSVQQEEGDYIYIDNEETQEERNKREEKERIIAYIDRANHMGELEDVTEEMLKDSDIKEAYDKAKSEIENLEQLQS